LVRRERECPHDAGTAGSEGKGDRHQRRGRRLPRRLYLSYLSDPKKKWEAHFEFARRAAAFKIQHLGNEAGLPTLDDIRKLPFAPEAPNRPRIVSSH
jgi:hypothetical protein